MKIYIIEYENNKELENEISSKYYIEHNVNKLHKCKLVIVCKVDKYKEALCIVDAALQMGIEILCVKNKFSHKSFISNLLISEGAMYI